MMSFSMVKSAAGADHYFMESDNYYLKSDEYADRFQWWGKGAENLGLGNKIDRDIFLSILEGKLPNGAEIPSGVNGIRRPGFDLTFSAPKSVSILALIYGKHELIDAHQEAVNAVLEVVEQTAAQARIKGENGTEIELTKNLIVAKFLHDTSRELDANLHTHALVVNATERSDGQWRALASNTMDDNAQFKGFFEHIYQDQIYYSTIYRSALANILTNKLGYEIEILPENEGGKHGMFEIKGFPQDLKDNFSKRRAEIEKLIDENEAEFGAASAKTRDYLTLTSRRPKEAIDRKELHEKWMEDINRDFSDFDPESLKKAPGQKNTQELPLLAAREAVIEATRHFAESRLVFTYKDLATKGMQFTLGKASFENVNSAIQQLREENVLVSLSESEMTSKEILVFEKSLLDKAQNVKKNAVSTEVNEKVLDRVESSNHQKNTVRNILESKDGISIVNMSLYEHPEQFIETLLNTAEHSGQRVNILTPTKTHSNELQKSIKRRTFSAWNWVVNILNKPETAQTVRGYLYHNQEPDVFSSLLARKGKDILVIDAAHRLGNQDLDGLLGVAEAKSAKIIFLNSDDALKGGAAGSPIDLMRKAKVKEYDLSENKLPRGAINTAVLEVLDDKERAELIAQKYGDLDEHSQRDTHVVAHTNKQADLLNQEIRNTLKNKGQLSENEIAFRTLSPVYLTGAEKKFATQYQNDMVLKHFQKGKMESYLILKYIEEDNTVLLLNEKQEKISWNPGKTNWKTMLYRKGELEISEGDRLSATDNMRHLGIESGQQLKVNAIGKKGLEIFNEGTGEILKIDSAKLRDSSLKYAYATTILGAASEQRSHVIADIKGFAAKQEMMNELKARATKSIDILTDNEERLNIQVEKAQLKSTTMDTLITTRDEIPELQKFIDGGTIKHFEKDFDEVATLLAEKFKGIDKRTLAQKSLDYVLAKLSEREAAFKHNDLVKDALQYAMQERAITGSDEFVDLKTVQQELDDYRKEGKLHSSSDGTYWVTKEALECEREIIKISKEGMGQVKNLLSKEEAFQILSQSELTRGQKNAAYSILTTKDRFMIVQGDPGTGKTSMVNKVKEVLETVAPVCAEQEVKIRGVAPTYQAVKELEAIGVPSQTLKSFLIENADISERDPADRPDYSKTVFILDEYSMVSNNDARDFKKIIASSNSRGIHLGDIKQFEAVPAGRPQAVEMKAGVKTVHMEELVRQQNKDAQQIAKAAIKGDVAGVFAAVEKMDASQYIERDKDHMTPAELRRLERSVHDVSTSILYVDPENPNETMHEKLARVCTREYVTRTPETRATTPVIVLNHKNRAEINGMIRDELKKNNELSTEGGLTLNRLVRDDTLKTDIKEANLGGASHIRLGNNYYQVVKVDRKNKALLLRGEDGKVEAFDAKRDLLKYKENYEVFTLEEKEIVANDLIMLRKNDPKRGHRANVDYVVKGIDGKTVHLENKQDGAKISLDSSLLRDAHWDYAYTKTGYSMQGASALTPIVHASSKEDKLAHLRSIIIMATRHKHHCMIVTDDKAAVIEKFSRPNDKLSAMEVMGELPSDPNQEAKEAGAKPQKRSSTAKGRQGSFNLKEKTLDSKGVNSASIHTPEKGNIQAKESGNSEKKAAKASIVIEKFDAKDIEFRLNDQAEMVAEHLLGKPNKTSSKEWRFGNKDCITVSMSGDSRGKWYNFESGEGGNLFSLIQQELGFDFKAALGYGANLVGGGKVETVKRLIKEKEEAKKSEQLNQWKDKEVARYFKEAKAVDGTLAEKYLKEQRGLVDGKGLNLRFHPKLYSHKEEGVNGAKDKNIYHPGLVSFALDKDGNPTGMQAVYLDEKTGNKRDDVPVGKRSFGYIGGSHITIANGNKEDKISFIAEGVETAMSIRDAAPGHQVIATLSKSNFKNVDPNRLAKIIFLCMDNDRADTIKHGKVVNDAIEKLKKAGKDVFVVMPKKEGADFNDILKKEGREGVRKELQNKLSGDKFKERMVAFEKDTKLAGKIADRLKKDELLNKVSKKELEQLMKSFEQAKPNRNNQPQKQMVVEKIKHIRDREIG